MKVFSPRLMYLYAFLLIVAMLGLGFYLQFEEGINPCPLCILQRVTLAVMGIVFFFGILLAGKKCCRIGIGLLSFLISLVGIFLAGRQVWLQHLPANQSGDCGVSLQYMLQVLPLHEVAKKIFEGTAECSRVDWSFVGLSMAEWTLVWFVVLGGFSLWQAFRNK